MADLFLKAQDNMDMKQALLTQGRVIPAAYTSALKENKEKNAHRDTKHLHPSELCKKDFCPRSAWYKINGYPAKEGNVTFSRINVYAEGNNIHDKWQRWLADAGILWGNWKCPECRNVVEDSEPVDYCSTCGYIGLFQYREVPIRSEEYMILGHADGVINDSQGKAVLEIKSIGEGTVRFEDYELWQQYNSGELTIADMWREIKTPFPSHVRQVNLYMHCLGIHNAQVVYESKMTQEVKEFSLRYMPTLIDHILVMCTMIKDHVERDQVPFRPAWAEDSNHKTCKYCPYRATCWKEYDGSTDTNTTTAVSPVVLPARQARKRNPSTTRVIRSTR